ncbi:MAG: cation:proton antiporter [Candidatus Omnitrophica bacterium]|nr:cation:proton antiporter [Candidatus Omnitrophota bacterium]
MNILFLAGIAIFLGTVGAKLFQRFKIPQVVGYIIAGVLIGPSVLKIWSPSTLQTFTPLIQLTLGIIGFMIGSELKIDVFKKYGRSIYTILITEGVLAFAFVAFLVTLITKKLYLGLLLGAIASATAPASTINVLWEYKARGPLTTTLTSIVALDDGLALILYGFASAFAKSMLVKENFSLFHSIGVPLLEIGKSLILGAGVGYGLYKLLNRTKEKERAFLFSLGAIIITLGTAIFLKLDIILPAMILGVTISNLIPAKNGEIFKSIKKFGIPLYVLFFVIAGARLDIGVFSKISILLLAMAYLLGMGFGKVSGAYLGGLLSKAKEKVTKYLGICLFAQAGVALGLAMSVQHSFSLLGPEGENVGFLVMNVVVAGVFVSELIGPPCIRLGLKKADEMWRNVTTDDIIESCKVADVMQKDYSLIKEGFTLNRIMKIVKEGEEYHFPVVDNFGILTGRISLGDLKNTFLEEDLSPLILAKDIAMPADKVICQGQPLKEAFEIFNRRELNCLMVVESEKSRKVVGILEYYPLVKLIDKRLLERKHGLEKA